MKVGLEGDKDRKRGLVFFSRLVADFKLVCGAVKCVCGLAITIDGVQLVQVCSLEVMCDDGHQDCHIGIRKACA